MNQLKNLWENYRKEILIVLFTIVVMIGIGGVFLYHTFQKDEGFSLEAAAQNNHVSEEERKVIDDGENAVTNTVENYFVDIKGEVKTPGVYIAQSSERVIDVIQKAGGFTKNADTSVNNLGRKVQDEMVIIIYSKEEVKNFKSTKEKENAVIREAQQNSEGLKNDAALEKKDVLGNQDLVDSSQKDLEVRSDESKNDKESDEDLVNKVNINTASKEELMSIKGIGESKADAIILYRTEKEKFQTIGDVMKVSGIGESLFAKIKEFITV